MTAPQNRSACSGEASPVSARYAALHHRFVAEEADEVLLSRSELQTLVHAGLPARALAAAGDAWSNSTTDALARAWRTAGWRCSEVRRGRDDSLESVSFRRGATTGLDLDELRHRRVLEIKHAWDALLRGTRHGGAARREDVHVRDRWWEEHLVYELHMPDLGLRKVGITRADARRLAETRQRWRAVTLETVTTSCRFEAQLVEARVLEAVEDWYDPRAVDVFTTGGYTETWSDDGPVIPLASLLVKVRRDLFRIRWCGG